MRTRHLLRARQRDGVLHGREADLTADLPAPVRRRVDVEIEEPRPQICDLRGRDHRVFFVFDVERLAALQGCKLDPDAPADQRCATLNPFSATWSSLGDQLTFSDTFPATAAHLWLRPWTRIASTG